MPKLMLILATSWNTFFFKEPSFFHLPPSFSLLPTQHPPPTRRLFLFFLSSSFFFLFVLKGRNRIAICWLIFFFSKACDSQGWAKLNPAPGTQSKFPTAWAIICCLPGCAVAGSWNWKWSGGSNSLTQIWHGNMTRLKLEWFGNDAVTCCKMGHMLS